MVETMPENKSVNKNSFIIYNDSLDVLNELSTDQVGELFLAIRDYQNGVEPKLSGLMKAIFIPFKNQFDRECEKYKKICEKRKLYGKKGGDTRVNNVKQSQPKSSKCKQKLETIKQNQANAYDNDNVTEKEKENDKVTDKDNVTDKDSDKENVTENENNINNFIINKCNLLKREKRKLGCRFENSDFYAEDIPDAFFNVFDSIIKNDVELASKKLDANRTYQSFRDYWIGKSGKDATKVDWIATWRNWIRNAKPSQKQNTLLSKDEHDRQYFEHIRNIDLNDFSDWS